MEVSTDGGKPVAVCALADDAVSNAATITTRPHPILIHIPHVVLQELLIRHAPSHKTGNQTR